MGAGPMELTATSKFISFDDVRLRPAEGQYRLYRNVERAPSAVPPEMAGQPEDAAEWDPADQQPWLDDRWMLTLAKAAPRAMNG